MVEKKWFMLTLQVTFTLVGAFLAFVAGASVLGVLAFGLLGFILAWVVLVAAALFICDKQIKDNAYRWQE